MQITVRLCLSGLLLLAVPKVPVFVSGWYIEVPDYIYQTDGRHEFKPTENSTLPDAPPCATFLELAEHCELPWPSAVRDNTTTISRSNSSLINWLHPKVNICICYFHQKWRYETIKKCRNSYVNITERSSPLEKEQFGYIDFGYNMCEMSRRDQDWLRRPAEVKNKPWQFIWGADGVDYWVDSQAASPGDSRNLWFEQAKLVMLNYKDHVQALYNETVPDEELPKRIDAIRAGAYDYLNQDPREFDGCLLRIT